MSSKNFSNVVIIFRKLKKWVNHFDKMVGRCRKMQNYPTKDYITKNLERTYLEGKGFIGGYYIE